MPEHIQITPRLIRLRDAAHYLGMDRNRFNHEVRPRLIEVRIGSQGIAFDRLALDAWVDDYMKRNGRRPKVSILEDDLCQTATKCQVSVSKAGSGRSKNVAATPKAAGSVKAREHLAALKRKKS